MQSTLNRSYQQCNPTTITTTTPILLEWAVPP